MEDLEENLEDTATKALSAIEIGAYFYENILDKPHPLNFSTQKIYDKKDIDDLKDNYLAEEYGDLLETFDELLT